MRAQLTRPRAVACALAALTALVVPRKARSDEKCIDAYEHAQELRQAKKLMEARSELRVCAAPACPAATTKDCSVWLKEVEAALPSIHVAVLDPSGSELHGARVFVDDSESGADVIVAPGDHSIRCELDGATMSRQVTLANGERNRVVECVIASRPPEPEPPKPPPVKALPVGTIAAGSIAVVAAAFWAGFGIKGIEDRTHLKNTCYPHCSKGDVGSVEDELIAADVSFGVTMTALAVGTVLFFVEKPYAPPRAALYVMPSPTGCSFGMAAQF